MNYVKSKNEKQNSVALDPGEQHYLIKVNLQHAKEHKEKRRARKASKMAKVKDYGTVRG